jgi:hypothetical protein
MKYLKLKIESGRSTLRSLNKLLYIVYMCVCPYMGGFRQRGIPKMVGKSQSKMDDMGIPLPPYMF